MFKNPLIYIISTLVVSTFAYFYFSTKKNVEDNSIAIIKQHETVHKTNVLLQQKKNNLKQIIPSKKVSQEKVKKQVIQGKALHNIEDKSSMVRQILQNKITEADKQYQKALQNPAAPKKRTEQIRRYLVHMKKRAGIKLQDSERRPASFSNSLDYNKSNFDKVNSD